MTAGVDVQVAKRAFRQVWRGASLCALACGATAASSALSYVSAFPTEASRHQLALSTASDTGLSVLLGPVSSIDTVGGYTVYKTFVFLTTIGAIWAILTTTRLLRGEEDAGRWQLVLAGSTRASRCTAATLAAIGGAVGVIFAGTTALTLAAGRNADVAFRLGGALCFGLSIATPTAVFVAVGALTSQLGRTRRAASMLGMVVFGVTFVLRMVADAGAGTRWLLWLTPFGWTELMRPLTHNDLVPLLPAVGAVVVLTGAAVMLASRRDVGDGVLASRDVARLRPFGLDSAFGLTARLELPVLIAWCVGACFSGLAFGVIAKMTTTAAPGSVSHTLDKFGVHGSFANQYFGVAFLLAATLVALLPAGQVGAASEEETSGRLVSILSRATGRTSWFAGRIALGASAVVVAALLSGFGMWLGAASQGVHVSLPTLLGAGLNVVPSAFGALAVGTVVLAIAPRAAAASVYGVVVWSLLVDILGSMVSGLGGFERVSLFHYMALAPAQSARATPIVVTTAAALALCVGATALFSHRDVRRI